MNDVAAAAILGLVQGLTEFLPISSTAHLILAGRLLGLDLDGFGLSFAVALHMGTLVAVLVYFLRTWLSLLGDLLTGRPRIPLRLALGTVPAAAAGVALESLVERELRGGVPIAIGLVVGSLAILLAERATRGRRPLDALTPADALLVGAAQALALVPGISRSGITISSALLRGFERADAARLSFLLATPVIAGAGGKTLLDARKLAAFTAEPDALAVGFAVSLAAGLAAIAFLMRFLRTRSLGWFVPYRLALAVVAVVLG